MAPVPVFSTRSMAGFAANGDMVDFEGEALQLPGVNFKAILTRITD